MIEETKRKTPRNSYICGGSFPALPGTLPPFLTQCIPDIALNLQ